MSARRKIFKRLERDREFIDRLIRAGVAGWNLFGMFGQQIDDYAWRFAKMQRRIVEDEG